MAAFKGNTHQVEEYSRVCFEVGVLERLRGFRQVKERREDDEWEPPSASQVCASMLSDELVDAFVIVNESSLDRRYSVMGAIRVALDLLPDEVGTEHEQGER